MPKMEEKLEKGQICFWSTNNLFALKWQDKREVYIYMSVVGFLVYS
jgi:hypothetical protein